MTERDSERLDMAVQAANLLAQDLRELAKAENPTVSALANEMLGQAVQAEQRLAGLATTS